MFSYAAALLYLSCENHPEPLPLGQQENFFETSIIADFLPTWNINPRFLFLSLLPSFLFVFGIEGGKKERKGMKKGTDTPSLNTIFQDDTVVGDWRNQR